MEVIGTLVIGEYEISVGDIYTYDDKEEYVTGIIKFGRYEQWAGSGEYSIDCYGLYFEIIDISVGDRTWLDIEDVMDLYPDYARIESVLEIFDGSTYRTIKKVNN